jgi:hypothetical protein
MLYFNPKVTIDFKSTEHLFSDFGAYSMSWPSITFADNKESVYVANGHNTETLLRIPVSNEGVIDKICLTYITPNQWLFVLVFCSDNYYRLYEMNLKKRMNFFNSE